MTQELQILSILLKEYLEELSPVLSGNMVREIILAEVKNVSENKVEFVINAPFYDMSKWQKQGVIVHTHKNYNGVTNYAQQVNDNGAFGKHNSSEHWVNRVCVEIAKMIPDAVVINKVEL